MNKPQVFKCRKTHCYCNQSWVVSVNRRALFTTRSWREALNFALLEQAIS